MKKIEICGIYEFQGTEYVDFNYDGIGYRWYTKQDKFSKIYHLPGDWSKAVRGNERREVMAQLREMVGEMKQPKVDNVVDMVAAFTKRQTENEAKRYAAFFLDLMEGQSQETIEAAMEALNSGDFNQYMSITAPIICRKAIKEANDKRQ